jgi:hypothetical protein
MSKSVPAEPAIALTVARADRLGILIIQPRQKQQNDGREDHSRPSFIVSSFDVT